MPIKFPCKICEKPVAQNHQAICCDVCDTWVHIKCMQQNKHSNLQHFEKRKGFLELYRVFQVCFSLLKIKRNQFLNNNSCYNKLKFITTRKKHNTQEEKS